MRGGLVHRPRSELRLEDLGGVRRDARRAERPRSGASPRDHRRPWITGTVLEPERRGCASGGVDECLARQLHWCARFLLVAVEHDRHVHPGENPSVLHRAQRLEDDHVAALHVDHAGPACGGIRLALEALERAARLEHRIEMPDEE